MPICQVYSQKEVTVKSFLCFIGVLFSGTVIAQPEIKGNPEDLRGFLHPTGNVVVISASAEEKAYSDVAIISLVVTTENKMLSQSIADNSSLRDRVNQELLDSGIEESAIKSSKFSSSPEYGWFGSKPSSFKVVNRMAISIIREEHLEEIAKIADRYKQVVLSDTVFEHSKKKEYLEKVKAKALADILKQKDMYESLLDLKLRAVGIRDSNEGHRASRGAMMLEEVVVTASLRKGKSLPLSKQRSPAQESSFDEVVYTSDLVVDFEIIDQ
nr:SIMPL domain-containing protein [Pseudoteredinibacter isoporae]